MPRDISLSGFGNPRRQPLAAWVMVAAFGVVSCSKPPASDTPARESGTVVPTPATVSDSTGGVTAPATPADTASPPQTATPASSASNPDGLPADTLRGVIVRVGNDPVSVLVLRLVDETVYALKTADLAQLGRVEGLEVMVSGNRLGTRNYSASPRGAVEFEVKSFVVRAADGQPATDGVVRSSGGAFSIEIADGSRKPAPHFPAELRVKPGTRVFLVGPLNQPPILYGIISQPK